MTYKEEIQMFLLNQQNAYRFVLEKLKKIGYQFSQVILINQNRYHFVIGEPNILILFKKEHFHSFETFFKHLGAKGEGETINLNELKYAAQHNVEQFYFIYPDGNIFTISMQEFLEKSHKRENWFEEKSIRCISIKDLHSFDPEQLVSTPPVNGFLSDSGQTLLSPLFPSQSSP